MNELIQIREAVEEVLGVKIDETRKRSVVEAKATFCYLAHRFTNCTLQEIATGAGLSNHATAYHHIKNTRAMIGIYPEHAEIVEQCEAELISLGMNVEGKRDVKKRYDLAKLMLKKWSQEVEKIEKELFGEVRAVFHPAISHINCDENISKETVNAINKMVDCVIKNDIKNEK